MEQGIKRKDMGIAGALIVVIQGITALQSTNSVSADIEALRKEIQQSAIERERFFVRKTDLLVLTQKIDDLADKVTDLKSHLEDSYSMECEPDDKEVAWLMTQSVKTNCL